MKNNGDNRLKTFEQLRRESEYSEKLLTNLESGDFNCLYEINIEDRNNEYYMEPLLYAVKNSKYSTYEIYKYYGEELQQRDFQMAAEIAENEPEVLEDTATSNNATLMVQLAKINSEVILYMSEALKSNGKFIEELLETGNKEAISNVIRECNIAEVIQDNPNLASNPEFMKEAIKEDANVLKYVDEKLKNDYDFINEASKENREVINYVAEHTNEFGKEALEGAKDSLEEHLKADVTQRVKEERAKLQEEKDNLTPEQIKRKERDLNAIDKMLKMFEEAATPEKKGRIAHLVLTTTSMEQYQNMEEYSNGVVHEKIDPEFIKELEKYEKLYLAAKEKAEKAKTKDEQSETENKNQTNEQEPKKEMDNIIVTPEQIEEKTSEARISEINDVTQGIREEYIRETQEKEVEVGHVDRGIIEK